MGLFRKIKRTVHQIDPYDGGKGGHLQSPPMFTFDPQLEFQRGSQQRGLIDQGRDTIIQARQAHKDTKTQLGDIRYEAKTQRQDVHRSLERSLQESGLRRTDTKLKRERSREDFGRQLDLLTRRFQSQAGNQFQQANAYGVLGGGTEDASAVARSRNQALSEQEINLDRTRMEQDVQTNLGRISDAERRAQEDAARAQQRISHDQRHDVKITRREYHQQLGSLYRELERAIREQRLGDVALLQQEIYQARDRNPNAISKTGKKTGGD